MAYKLYHYIIIMELDKYLALKKPDLSIHTQRVYSSQLIRMVKKLNMLIDDISDFDKYKNEIIAYLDTIPDNSRKSTCSAYLALGANNDVNTIIKAKYHVKYSLVCSDEYIPWLLVIEKYKNYSKHCVRYIYDRIPGITHDQYFKLQTYVYLSCNILAPPRPNSFWVSLKKCDIDLIGGDRYLKGILTKWFKVQIYNDYLFTNIIDRATPITEIQLENYHHYIPHDYKISYTINTLINSFTLYKLDNTDNSQLSIEDFELKIKHRRRKYDYTRPEIRPMRPSTVVVVSQESLLPPTIGQPIQVFFD